MFHLARLCIYLIHNSNQVPVQNLVRQDEESSSQRYQTEPIRAQHSLMVWPSHGSTGEETFQTLQSS